MNVEPGNRMAAWVTCRVKTIEYTSVVKTEKVPEEVQCFLTEYVLQTDYRLA
jgi:hypothetical protein